MRAALGLFHNAALGCAPLMLVTLLWAAKAFSEEPQKCQCTVVWQSCEWMGLVPLLMLAQHGARVAAPALAVMTRKEA